MVFVSLMRWLAAFISYTNIALAEDGAVAWVEAA